MKPYSITRRLIATVLLIELISALCVSTVALVYERHVHFRAFDVLVKQQIKISKSKNEQEFNNSKNKLLDSFKSLKEKCDNESGTSFFYGSCIGLDGSQNQFAERKNKKLILSKRR